jgi:hypothetical protein
MAQASNVHALGEHPRARARLTPTESADVLTGCRELALQRVAASVSSMLDKLDEDLYTLAEGSKDADAKAVFLDARLQSRSKRSSIEEVFRRHFLDCFNRRVRGESGNGQRDPDSMVLALVDPEDLEESLAVEEMARKLRASCEGELFALSQRMGFLLERPDLGDEGNPLSPATICDAMREAFDQVESGFKVRMTLMRQFERHVGEELQRVYRDVNAHLVERRILPEVAPAKGRRNPSKAEPIKPVPDKPAVPTGNDLFATLAELMGQGAGGLPMAAGAPGASQPFLEQLTRMHRETAALAVTAGGLPANVVKGLRADPGAAKLGTVDAMTIDIVAMLFDYIFEDRSIPASVKALLGRLQIPTLKVALMDKGLFSTKTHPTRRLLDGLAGCSIGLDESRPEGKETLAMVERTVDRVLAEFETDVAIFETLASEVAAYVEERARAESLVVERSAQLIEARERVEIARITAEEEVARRLEVRAWVPPVVREMLLQSWTDAMAACALREGEGSPGWQSLVSTMEDLLWSVEPKCAPEDRKGLVGMLPGMLKRLHEGFGRAQAPDDVVSAFLGALVDCHAAAVKAGLRGIGAVPAAPAPEPAPAAAPALERAVVPAGDIQVEEIRLKSPRGSAVRNVFTRTGIWTNLERGTWVEFARGDGAALLGRLTWISPNKGVYLFTNPHAPTAAVSVSPEALAEQMRRGEARILENAPLMERAVGSMLESLRKSGGAA